MSGASKKPAGGRPKRRTFTAEYKLQVLEEYERLLREGKPGEPGALLRGSHTARWRPKGVGVALPEDALVAPRRVLRHLLGTRWRHTAGGAALVGHRRGGPEVRVVSGGGGAWVQVRAMWGTPTARLTNR